MRSRHSVFQVVEVIGPGRVRDVRSNEWPYWRRDGQMLAKGYYIVSWPTGPQAGRFNDEAEFRGPFPRLHAAEEALQSIFAARTADQRPAQSHAIASAA